MKSYRNTLLTCLFFVLFLSGVWFQDQVVVNCTEPAVATIVSVKVEEKTGHYASGKNYYYNVYIVQVAHTLGGEQYVGKVESREPEWVVGETVGILYNPKRPMSVRLPGDTADIEWRRGTWSGRLYSLLIFSAVIGVFLLIASYTDRKRYRRRMKALEKGRER